MALLRSFRKGHARRLDGGRSVSTLILLRHGQSVWNGHEGHGARFTGWADVPLTVRGRVEAVAAGQLLRQRGFTAGRVDVAFTSELERAHETCELALASMAGPEQDSWSSDRIRRDERLNERHYGVVQGEFKHDPEVLERFGRKTVREWRRSMHAKPPALCESHEHWRPPPAPTTESLADCQERALDCYHTTIAPALFDEDLPTPPDERTVVVVAHSNTIRSLIAAFDRVPHDSVPKLHVPNSVPILYRFDRTTRAPISAKLQSKAGGSHARWLLSAENHKKVRQAIQPGGTLTRAFFDALDVSQKRALRLDDFERGLRELLQDDDVAVDCVVSNLAKKIVRELSITPDGATELITLADFERRAAEAIAGLQEAPTGSP